MIPEKLICKYQCEWPGITSDTLSSYHSDFPNGDVDCVFVTYIWLKSQLQVTNTQTTSPLGKSLCCVFEQDTLSAAKYPGSNQGRPILT